MRHSGVARRHRWSRQARGTERLPMINNNSANNNGGGIDNSNGGRMTISNVRINGNSAQFGGGMSNFATITLTDVSLSGNSATPSGGGTVNGFGAAFTLSSGTIDNNTAD